MCSIASVEYIVVARCQYVAMSINVVVSFIFSRKQFFPLDIREPVKLCKDVVNVVMSKVYLYCAVGRNIICGAN